MASRLAKQHPLQRASIKLFTPAKIPAHNLYQINDRVLCLW